MAEEKVTVKIRRRNRIAGISVANDMIKSGWTVSGFELVVPQGTNIYFEREIPDPPTSFPDCNQRGR
jgi:hypothetical protein